MVDVDVVGDIDVSKLGKEEKKNYYYDEIEKYGIILIIFYFFELVEIVNFDFSYGEKMVLEIKFLFFIINVGIC